MRTIMVIVIALTGCEIHSKDEVQLVSRTPPPVSSPTRTQPDTPKPIADGGRIVLPTPIRRVEPTFLEMPRRDVVVVVELTVTTGGDVRGVKLLRGEHTSYARAVLAAAKQWEFRPGTVDGKPREMTYELTVKVESRRSALPSNGSPTPGSS